MGRLSPLNEKLVATVNKNQEFKAGDLVEAYGVSGRVEAADVQPTIVWPIKVKFSCGQKLSFTEDGKLELWHKIPSLKLISRPQKTEKKKVWVKAYEQNPAAGHEEPRYILVQIEVEAPVEE